MKRMFLTAMALAFSFSTMAAQPLSKVGMTLIEDKNQGIMSSYKDYSQARQQSRQLKQSLAQQQYSEFLQYKQTSMVSNLDTSTVLR